jgi:hypothetical protein
VVQKRKCSCVVLGISNRKVRLGIRAGERGRYIYIWWFLFFIHVQIGESARAFLGKWWV